MRAAAIVSSIGFLLVVAFWVFSCWAEWGVYPFLIDWQIKGSGKYGEPLTLQWMLGLTFVSVIVLFSLMMVTFGRARISAYYLCPVACGIPAVCMILHLVATVYFLLTGGGTSSVSSMDSAIRGANLFPHAVILKRESLWPLDVQRAVRGNQDIFVAFDTSASPDIRTTILLKTNESGVKKLEENLITGTIRAGPLPYIVRRLWKDDRSIFGVILEQDGTVRGFWALPAFIYLVLIVFAGWVYRRIKASRA